MAVPSNKLSSSPIASRANPNLRNSEVVNPMRRSFSGNPFVKPSIVANPRSFNPNTPANSPSEHPRRSSMGRETVVAFHDSEDKENSKDQNWKPMRVRSPIGAKGAKNFMSPTISAASKITAVSPRKKILVERNEVARTTVSLSDFKKVSFAPTMEGSDHKEVARTTVSLSDFKKVSFAPTMENSDHKEISLTTPLVSKALKTQVDLDSNEPSSSMNEPEEPVCVNASEEPDSVNLDPSFKISPPGPSCPEASGSVLAPLDADPSVPPPYDPKTNYLSPRPQFLHYRPNPRIEYYLSNEKEGKRLEDSFISGSFSDTEATEETQSEFSQKELEDVTSDAVVEQDQQLEEKEVEEEVHVSEPSPVSPLSTLMSKEEAVEVKGSCKPSFFWRSKFTALVIVLAVAVLSVSVMNSPLIDGSLLKDLSFVKECHQFEVAEFARASFDGLARNFRVWSDNSVSFISELISNLKGAHNLAPLHYCNLTVLTEDVRVDGYSLFDHSYKGTDGMYEFDVLGHTMESLVEIEAMEEKGQPEIRATEDIVEALVDPEYEGQVDQEAEALANIEALEEKGQPEDEAAEKIVEVHVDPEYEEQAEQEAEAPVDKEPLEEKGQPEIEASENIVEVHVDPEQSEQETAQADVTELKSTETDQGQDENVVSDHADSEPESNVSMKEETVMISQAAEGQSEVFEVEELQAESKMSTDTDVEFVKQDHTSISSEVDSSPENMQSLEAVDHIVDGGENKVSLVNEMGSKAFIYVALLVSALIGSTAFIYVKKGKSSTPNPAISVVQPLLTKKLDAIPNVPVSTENTFQERPSSWNWDGEPCPSEMSSFQKGSTNAKKGLKQSDEAERQEKRMKNHRRESLASIDSSMGSPSYGSFTTYERIPIKHGHGEEEVVTPVRRSSRIRKQAISP